MLRTHMRMNGSWHIYRPGQRWQRPAFAGELFSRLLVVVQIKMEIAEGVNEIARREIDDLRHHHREERVRRNVERHTQEKIAAALVQLAT